MQRAREFLASADYCLRLPLRRAGSRVQLVKDLQHATFLSGSIIAAAHSQADRLMVTNR